MHNIGLLEAEVISLKNPKVLILSHYSMSEHTRPFWIFLGGKKDDKEVHLRKKQLVVNFLEVWDVNFRDSTVFSLSFP